MIFKLYKKLSADLLLVVALVVTNILNLFYNIFLGRVLTVEDFGVIALLLSILFILKNVFNAITTMMSHRIASITTNQLSHYFTGLKLITKKFFVYGLFIALLWVAIVPTVAAFLKLNSSIPILFFIPIYFFGLLFAGAVGILLGRKKFAHAGVAFLAESITHLLWALLLVKIGFGQFAYTSIALSISLAGLTALLLVFIYYKQLPSNDDTAISETEAHNLVYDSALLKASLMANFATMAFLSIDLILVRFHFTPEVAGTYALLAIGGKIIYFLGAFLFQNFMVPYVAQADARGVSTEPILKVIFGMIFVGVMGSVILFGVFGFHIFAFIIGPEKAFLIEPYILFYTLAIGFFTLATTLVMYHTAKRDFRFAFLSLLFSILLIPVFAIFNNSLREVVMAFLGVSILCFVSILILHTLSRKNVFLKNTVRTVSSQG